MQDARNGKIIENSFLDIAGIEAGNLSRDLINELTKIKGVGKWTAEMFLIFILFRKNIFSNGDLALLNSIKINYNLKILTNPKLESLKKRWGPYKTVASLLLWKSIEKKIFYQKK